MANYKKFIQHVILWEGGFVNDPADSGGATFKGVTIATYKTYGTDWNKDGLIDVSDLKKMTDKEFETIFKTKFWDKCLADSITDQMVANLCCQFFWGSGYSGTKLVQRTLNKIYGYSLTIDGVFGKATLKVINSCNANKLAQTLHEARLRFFQRLAVKRPKDKRFLKGWFNRQNALVSGESWYSAEEYALANFK